MLVDIGNDIKELEVALKGYFKGDQVKIIADYANEYERRNREPFVVNKYKLFQGFFVAVGPKEVEAVLTKHYRFDPKTDDLMKFVKKLLDEKVCVYASEYEDISVILEK